MAKLTIQEVQQKTTKVGKPYLNIKSSTGKYYSIWQEQQYIWHLFEAGKTLEVTVSTNGAFSNITGVEGISEPNKSGGTTIYKSPQEPLTGNGQTAWDKLFIRLEALDKKIDWLMEERKTLGIPLNDESWLDTEEQEAVKHTQKMIDSKDTPF